MPILIALALIQTTLITGIVIFPDCRQHRSANPALIYRLNLLLVARISAVIIGHHRIASISVISHKPGLSQALQVITFFLMIILAWTIERMSVLWEEDGPER